jgi:glutamine amidotransferase
MILILDYHMGNHHSVQRKLNKLGVDSIISSAPEDIQRADKIILPGVGHFGKAMEKLRELQLIEPLHHAVLVEKKPILGICLGMQLLSMASEEGSDGSVSGLGWINGKVLRFSVKDTLRYKVPHIGWNTVIPCESNRLFKGIDPGAEFYFVHSYYMQLSDQTVELASTMYETSFTCAVERDNIFGVQFHPEKSHLDGIRLLKNFVDL